VSMKLPGISSCEGIRVSLVRVGVIRVINESVRVCAWMLVCRSTTNGVRAGAYISGVNG
jgi:hypothetical protein